MKVKRLTSWFASMVFAASFIAAPLVANADYATCKQACLAQGHSDDDCSEACRE